MLIRSNEPSNADLNRLAIQKKELAKRIMERAFEHLKAMDITPQLVINHRRYTGVTLTIDNINYHHPDSH